MNRRGNALGIGSVGARIGAIAAPYIILWQDSLSWGPNVIFSAVSLVACITTLFMPETTGRTLPQTIEEAELFYAGIDTFAK